MVVVPNSNTSNNITYYESEANVAKMPSQVSINANDKEGGINDVGDTDNNDNTDIMVNRKPSAAEPENELVLTNFTDKAEYQAIYVSILSLTRSVGYESSLEKDKRLKNPKTIKRGTHQVEY